MPVSKKPRKDQLETFMAAPRRGDARRGDARRGDARQDGDKIYHQQVRIEQRYIDQIDELCQQRRTKTPRHAWLLEAIFEKMDREL